MWRGRIYIIIIIIILHLAYVYFIWVKSQPCAATYNGDNCLHLSSVYYTYVIYIGRFTRRDVYIVSVPSIFSWERSVQAYYTKSVIRNDRYAHIMYTYV